MSLAQVDPAWLKAWTEAQDSRPATLSATGRIAPHDEAGQPLRISGVVLQPDGEPAAGVVVHAYHRDAEGFELGPNDAALTTWELQGWVRTDSNGQFEFETVRPAPDSLGREGAHIHFTLESEAFGRQWATKVYFADDALVTPRQRRESEARGRQGAVREIEEDQGLQIIHVELALKSRADF